MTGIGITDSVSHARIRNPGSVIHLHVVIRGNSRTATVTGILHVYPLVIRGRVTVIHPQKGTNLFLAPRLGNPRNPVASDMQSLPRSQITHDRIPEIRER